MEDMIDDIVKYAVNKISYQIEDYLQDTFALIRRQTESNYATRFFNGLTESRYDIYKIINKYFLDTYENIKFENDPSIAKRIDVDRINENIEDLLSTKIRMGLNRLEYELEDILRDNYRNMERYELRSIQRRIMDRVTEYLDEFRLYMRRYSLAQLQEAKFEFGKLILNKFEIRKEEKQEKKQEVKRDPAIQNLMSKLQEIHSQSTDLNNEEEIKSFNNLMKALNTLYDNSLSIDELDQKNKKILTNMINGYLDLVQNEKNNKFKPIEPKQEELNQDQEINNLNNPILEGQDDEIKRGF